MRRNHRRSSVTGTDQRGCVALRNQFGGNTNGRARLAPQPLGRRFLHRDDIRCVDHPHVESRCVLVPIELSTNAIGSPHEIDPDSQMPSSSQRTVDNPTRRVIAAHRVNCDPHLGSDQGSVVGAQWKPFMTGYQPDH
jgi:hypothetical protein